MTGVLEGKVALVTGGSRGIGAAIAARLANDGADVAITYHVADDEGAGTVAEIERAGRRGVAIKADQADVRQAAGVVKTAVEHFGHIDILVNNAGVFITGPVDDQERDQEAFDRQFAVNVDGVASTVRAAALCSRRHCAQRYDRSRRGDRDRKHLRSPRCAPISSSWRPRRVQCRQQQLP